MKKDKFNIQVSRNVNKVSPVYTLISCFLIKHYAPLTYTWLWMVTWNECMLQRTPSRNSATPLDEVGDLNTGWQGVLQRFSELCGHVSVVIHQSGLEAYCCCSWCLVLSEGLDRSPCAWILVTGERTEGILPTFADVVGPITLSFWWIQKHSIHSRTGELPIWDWDVVHFWDKRLGFCPLEFCPLGVCPLGFCHGFPLEDIDPTVERQSNYKTESGGRKSCIN